MSYSCRNLWLGVDLSYCGTESSQKRTTNHTFWLPLSGLSETTVSPPVTSWTTARRKAKIFWILFGPIQKLMIFMFLCELQVWRYELGVCRYELSCSQVWTFMFTSIFWMFWSMNLHVCKYELLGFSRLQVWNSIPYTWLSQACK